MSVLKLLLPLDLHYSSSLRLRSRFVFFAIAALGLVLLSIVAIILVSLIPVYLSKTSSNTGEKKKTLKLDNARHQLFHFCLATTSPSITLKYALPSSIQVATRAKAASNRILLIQSGPLTDDQRARFQAVVRINHLIILLLYLKK